MPVISSPDRGVLASLLAQHDCGSSYPHGDDKALARLVAELAADPNRRARLGANSLRLFEASFRAERVYGDFSAYLADIARQSVA